MHCCLIGCDAEAEYEIWFYGVPQGFDCYRLIDGMAWYEQHTHSCAAHIEDLKCHDPREQVVHFSKSTFSFPRVELVPEKAN